MSAPIAFTPCDTEQQAGDEVCTACGDSLRGSNATITEFVQRLTDKAAMQRVHPICTRCERKAMATHSVAAAVLADVNARGRHG